MEGRSVFRQEVRDVSTWIGGIQVVSPPSRWLYVGLAVCLVISVVIVLKEGHFTRTQVAKGTLVSSKGLLTVGADISGIVTRVAVDEGTDVKEGQLVVEIRSDTDTGGYQEARRQIASGIGREIDTLHVDSQNVRDLSRARIESARAKLARLDASREQLVQEVAIDEKLAVDSQKFLEKIAPLVQKGYVSGWQVQQQQSSVYASQVQLKVAKRQLIEVQQSIADVESDIARENMDLKALSNDLSRKLAGTQERLIDAESRRVAAIRSPTDGALSTVLVKVGQRVAAGQAVASIFPKGSTLQAQIMVPGGSVAFINRGAKVILRYAAFPYRKYGVQYGKVIDVSAAALAHDELISLHGDKGADEEGVYKLVASLDRQDIPVGNGAETLKPGMTFQADIVVERRSFIDWILGRTGAATSAGEVRHG